MTTLFYVNNIPSHSAVLMAVVLGEEDVVTYLLSSKYRTLSEGRDAGSNALPTNWAAGVNGSTWALQA